MDIEEAIQELLGFVKDSRVTALNTIACLVVLSYDIILTLDQEIDFIWSWGWSGISVLHILTRYFSLAYLLVSTYVQLNTQLSLNFCKAYFYFQLWGAALFVPAADIIIVMRIYALYGQNLKAGLFTVLLWLVELGVLFGFITRSFTNVEFIPNPLPGIFPGCFSLNTKEIFVLEGGVIAVGIQVIYLSMTLYVLFKRFGRIGFISNMTPLLYAFFRDGALYCFIVLAMYIINLLFVKLKSNSELEVIGIGWLMSIIAISTGRMVFNLRATVRVKHDRWTQSSENTQGDVILIGPKSLDFEGTLV